MVRVFRKLVTLFSKKSVQPEVTGVPVDIESLFLSPECSYFLSTVTQLPKVKTNDPIAKKNILRSVALGQMLDFMEGSFPKRYLKQIEQYSKFRSHPELTIADCQIPIPPAIVMDRVAWMMQFKRDGDNRKCAVGYLVLTEQGLGVPVTAVYPSDLPTPAAMRFIKDYMSSVNGALHWIMVEPGTVVVGHQLNEHMSCKEYLERYNDVVVELQ